MILSVREMIESDIELIVNYFINSSPEFLRGMGADINLLPKKENWIAAIQKEFHKTYKEKQIYYVIWQINKNPVGHSNINNITFNQQANMHLHMWNTPNRKKGLGLQFVKNSIPFYFKHFHLKQLICEPYAHNPAPVRTLPKLGFEFEREYVTIPGKICFQQLVRRYRLEKEKFEELV